MTAKEQQLDELIEHYCQLKNLDKQAYYEGMLASGYDSKNLINIEILINYHLNLAK